VIVLNLDHLPGQVAFKISQLNDELKKPKSPQPQIEGLE
jgi:hypothetical protein